MIFPNLKFDKVVQLCDCIRFDATESVYSKPDSFDSVEKVEISPNGVDYVEIKNTVTDTKEVREKELYLDWCFDTKIITAIEDNSDESATNFSSFSSILQRVTQSWLAGSDNQINYYETHARLGTGSTGVGELVVDILDDNAGTPGAVVATSDPVQFSDLPDDDVTLSRFLFSSGFVPTQGETYYFALRIETTDNTSTILTYYPAGDTYADGSRWDSADGGTTYNAQANDLSFRIGSQSEATDGVLNPAIRITATDGRVFSKAFSLTLVTKEEDCLFSEDCDLIGEENDVMKWLPSGRTSFTWLHRHAKVKIFEFLDRMGWKDCNGNKFTKEDVFDIGEFKEWSRAIVLKQVFRMARNANADLYEDKYIEYGKEASRARERAYRLDIDGDGVDDGAHQDSVNIRSGLLIKR